MATKLPDTKRDPCQTIGMKIEEETDRLIKLIVDRKLDLFLELAAHEYQYDNLVSSKSATEKELLNLKQRTENITKNELKEIQDQTISEVEEKLRKLTLSVESFGLDFQSDSNIEQEIKEFGKIVKIDKTRIVPEYSEMAIPLVAVGKKGNEKHELDDPRGVALEEESQGIFVCDSSNSCVKVFDLSGKFVSDFGSNELVSPWGILLNRDDIYVTDKGKFSLLKYRRSDYKFLQSVGEKKSDTCQFRFPGQLAIGLDECLYVPDRENDTISVLDTDLNFKRHIQHESIVNPVDVKFTEGTMFVLSTNSTQFLSLFDLNGEFIRSCSSIDKVSAFFFTIDSIGNIVISRCGDHFVHVISYDGEFLCSVSEDGHEEGDLHYPFGIAISKYGDLVVVSNNENYGLQIF